MTAPAACPGTGTGTGWAGLNPQLGTAPCAQGSWLHSPQVRPMILQTVGRQRCIVSPGQGRAWRDTAENALFPGANAVRFGVLFDLVPTAGQSGGFLQRACPPRSWTGIPVGSHLKSPAATASAASPQWVAPCPPAPAHSTSATLATIPGPQPHSPARPESLPWVGVTGSSQFVPSLGISAPAFTLLVSLQQESETLCVKDFASLTVSVTTGKLCHCGTKAVTDNKYTHGHGSITIKLYL